MKTLIFFLFILLMGNASKSQDEHTHQKDREKIAMQLATAFKEGATNEQIINKFTDHSISEKQDTINRFTKESMDDIRETYAKVNLNDISVAKYLDQPERFYDYGEVVRNKRIVFSYYANNRQLDVDADDVYMIINNKKKKEAIQLILFNSENKIISFVCYRVGVKASFSPI